MKASKDIRVDGSANLERGFSELEVEQDVGMLPRNPVLTTKITIFTRDDIIAAFEMGAAFQRQSIFTPQSTNAVKAHEEALARWPE